MNKDVKYHLKICGEAVTEIQEMIGIYDSDYWFSVKQNRDNFIMNLRKLEYFCKNKGLTIEINDGVDVDKQTIYTATLKLPDGRTHNITHNFGYGYPVESAEFMFEEGNYSCDCNKSLFLQEQGFDIDEQPCGDEIEILSYNITLEG